MRSLKRFIASFLLASSLFLGACAGGLGDEDKEDDAEPPPDALTERIEEFNAIKATVAETKRKRKYDVYRADRTAHLERRKRLEAERLRRQAAKEREEAKVVSRRNSTPAREGQTYPTQSYEATFYDANCSTGCTGVTATGLDVSNTIYSPAGHRIIAVDPARIALGSLAEITLADGSTFRAVAEDVGGDVKGARIDVLVGSRAEAYRLGRQTAQVRIIRKGR